MSRARRPGPVPAALRVIAGELGGRRLDAPPADVTRPTTDRVRESMFNALESMGAVEGARVLDGYGGSGALAIESLSRGADHATLVERDRSAAEVARSNVAALGLADRCDVVLGPLERLGGSGAPYDLVLLDPPYAFDRWPELLDAVVRWCAADAVIVIESGREVALGKHLHGVRSRTYGSTVVQFASPTGEPS